MCLCVYINTRVISFIHKAPMSYRTQRVDAPFGFENFMSRLRNYIPELLARWRAETQKERNQKAILQLLVADRGLELRREMDTISPIAPRATVQDEYILDDTVCTYFAISHDEQLIAVALSNDLLLLNVPSGDETYDLITLLRNDGSMPPGITGHDHGTLIQGHNKWNHRCTCERDHFDFYNWAGNEGCPVVGHRGQVRCIAFSDDDTKLFSYSFGRKFDDYDSELKSWQIERHVDGRCTLNPLKSITLDDEIFRGTQILACTPAFAFSQNGRFFAEAHHLWGIRIFDQETTERNILRFDGYSSEDLSYCRDFHEYNFATFSPDSRLFVYSHRRGPITIVRSQDCSLVCKIGLFRRRTLISMAFSPDSQTLACYTRETVRKNASHVELWNIGKAEEESKEILDESHVRQTNLSEISIDTPFAIVYPPNDPTKLLLATLNTPRNWIESSSEKFPCSCFQLDAKTLKPIIGMSEKEANQPGFAFDWTGATASIDLNCKFMFSARGRFAVITDIDHVFIFQRSKENLERLRGCFRNLVRLKGPFRDLPPEVIDMMAASAYPDTW